MKHHLASRARLAGPLFFALLMLLAPTSARAQSSSGLSAVDDLRDRGAFEEAVSRLEALRAERPADPEVLWRLARTLVDQGEQAGKGDRQQALYTEAETVARAAVDAGPENAEAHLAFAIASGRLGLLAGTKEKVERSRTVKEAVDRAISLDPAHAGAYHVRARWNHEVASLGFFARTVVKLVYGGLPDASYENAVRDFEQAIVHEDAILHRLELGRTYLEMGEKAEAREQLERALAMPVDDPDDPAHQAEARELLRKAR